MRRKDCVLGVDYIFDVWHIVGAQYMINDQMKEPPVSGRRFFSSYPVSFIFSVRKNRGLSFGFLCNSFPSLGFLSGDIFSTSLVYLFLLFHGCVTGSVMSVSYMVDHLRSFWKGSGGKMASLKILSYFTSASV